MKESEEMRRLSVQRRIRNLFCTESLSSDESISSQSPSISSQVNQERQTFIQSPLFTPTSEYSIEQSRNIYKVLKTTSNDELYKILNSKSKVCIRTKNLMQLVSYIEADSMCDYHKENGFRRQAYVNTNPCCRLFRLCVCGEHFCTYC